ncbi:hypothetical protein BDN72DRAFT_851663 [Pluteus cervinus]|uniref:Uncharacterized protein n=1 Tax=Pluteus cervinus TaxID=181527 RepID=A0ACD2ZZ25_9AGAR|nr:hypothetical protein BDN72DRAFT_851663 [Pluteus cervinus]
MLATRQYSLTTLPQAHWNMEQSTSPSAFMAEQKKILDKIQHLYRQIEQLKARHNELAPINRLPPELFTRIFFTLQSNFYNETAEKYHKWMAVTQVSRSWRLLALETKKLWNAISHDAITSPSPWLETYLKLSKPLKLDVGLEFTLSKLAPLALDHIQEENHRIREIMVSIIDSGSPHRSQELYTFLQWLGMEMPVLEEFEIVGDDEILDSNLTVPALFNSLAPCLRSILIVDFNLTLQSLPFKKITHLTLRYGQGHSGSISLLALFDFLRISCLQTLDLRHALFGDTSHEKICDPVSVLSLQSVTIHLLAHQCSILLSHLAIPQKCRTIIWGFSSMDPDNTDFIGPQNFFDGILSHISDNLTGFASLDIKFQRSFITCDLRRQEELRDGTSSDPASLQIHLRALDVPFILGDWVSFPSMPQFPETRWLSLVGLDLGPECPVVKEFLSSLSFLRSLEEIELSLPFIPAFSVHIHNNPGSFAALKSLIVHDVLQDHTPLKGLGQALVKRKEVGAYDIMVDLLKNRESVENGSQPSEVLDRLREVCVVSISEL